MRFINELIVILFVSLSAHVCPAQTPEDEILKRVVNEMQAGNKDKAIAALGEMIDKHPDHADAYVLRSNLRMSSGDTYGALGDINRAIKLRPEMGTAYNERAKIRLMAQDLKGAVQDLDLAISHNYKVDGVYQLRGQLRSQLGDLKGAVGDLDDAIKLNPGNPQLYATRGSVLLALNENDKALAYLNYLLSWYETEPTKKIKVDPGPIESPPAADDGKKKKPGRFTIGINNETQNSAPGDKSMVPVIASAYLKRGVINSDRGSVEAAIADFTKSIRLDSSNASAFYTRALALENRGDWDAALADVSRAIQLDPMNGNLRVEHGVIQHIKGNLQAAQADFDMVLNADRNLWQKRIDERLAEVKKKLPK